VPNALPSAPSDLEPWLCTALSDDDLGGDLEGGEAEEAWDEDAESDGRIAFTCHCGFEGETSEEWAQHRACKPPAPREDADALFVVVNAQAISPQAREALRKLLNLAKR
jgi:hypothetical protein